MFLSGFLTKSSIFRITNIIYFRYRFIQIRYCCISIINLSLPRRINGLNSLLNSSLFFLKKLLSFTYSIQIRIFDCVLLFNNTRFIYQRTRSTTCSFSSITSTSSCNVSCTKSHASQSTSCGCINNILQVILCKDSIVVLKVSIYRRKNLLESFLSSFLYRVLYKLCSKNTTERTLSFVCNGLSCHSPYQTTLSAHNGLRKAASQPKSYIHTRAGTFKSVSFYVLSPVTTGFKQTCSCNKTSLSPTINKFRCQLLSNNLSGNTSLNTICNLVFNKASCSFLYCTGGNFLSNKTTNAATK